jgi:hypothetical protein
MDKKKQNQCHAIKTYNARPKAWEDIKKGTLVYMMFYLVNGKPKEKLVSQCGGYGANGGCFCKNHLKTKNIINVKEIETFFESHKEDKVIHPTMKDEITFKKMEISDPHFVNMAVQGNTKKNKSTIYDFKNLDDPILRILTDRDPRLKDDLRLFAIEKLQSSNKFVKKVSNETIEKVEIQKNQDNKLAEKLKKMTLENEQCKLYNSDDDEMSELSDNDEIISKEIDIKIEPELELDSDSEIIDEVDDDSAISAILINTKKGKVLYLDPNTLSVIEPEGDNEGDIIGRLIETPKKYGTIEKDNKFWTVISKIYCKEFDKDYLYDVLNYRLFDDGYNLIGNVYKNKEDKFQFQFNK